MPESQDVLNVNNLNVNNCLLKCMSLNVNGGLVGKLECSDFINMLQTYDIIFLSETWTNECSNIDLEGYGKIYANIGKERKVEREILGD